MKQIPFSSEKVQFTVYSFCVPALIYSIGKEISKTIGFILFITNSKYLQWAKHIIVTWVVRTMNRVLQKAIKV